MPTYVYRRPDGTTFEAFQKISDDALQTDPDTGVPVQRVISGGAGLQFKGTGFYLTDYVTKSGTPDKDDSKPAKKPASADTAPSTAEASASSGSASAGSASAGSASGPAPKASSSASKG